MDLWGLDAFRGLLEMGEWVGGKKVGRGIRDDGMNFDTERNEWPK